MKGLILAGGLGTRLYPSTTVINKHLLPIYDKPMIYYPLTTLIGLGIWDIAIISSPKDLPLFTTLFKRAKDWGIKLSYIVQRKPTGAGDVFKLGRSYVDNDPAVVILGDNILSFLVFNPPATSQSIIVTTQVQNPREFGIVYRTPEGGVDCIAEKPVSPLSNEAVIGFYFYKAEDFRELSKIKLTTGGMTEANNWLNRRNPLAAVELHQSAFWTDAGNPLELLRASRLAQTQRFGYPELAASRSGLLPHHKFVRLVDSYPDSQYRSRLQEAI